MSQSHGSPRGVDVRTQYIIAGTVRNYLAGFLVERRSRRLAKGTLKYYESELNLFCTWLDAQGIMNLSEVSADVVRKYLLKLEESRNAGGIHAGFRAIRAFFAWVELEFEDEGTDGVRLRNPMKRVTPPKVNKQAREGVSVETIRAMIEACKGGGGRNTSDNALRDRLILMVLFDTGVRASELLALDVEDMDIMTGGVVIRSGKGGKRRVVYLGGKSRKMLRNYFKVRGYTPGALFRTEDADKGHPGDRIRYQGLVKIIRRRAGNAGVKPPGIHDFRRAFAVESLRNGVDIIKLAEMLGHAGLEITRRYIKLLDEDIRLAHAMSSPVDKSL